MNIVPNENTTRGLSNGSNPKLLSAAVMEKISKNTTKPPVQRHIETIKTLKTLAKLNHRFHFFSSPFQLVRGLLRLEDIALLEAMIPRRAVMLHAKALQQ